MLGIVDYSSSSDEDESDNKTASHHEEPPIASSSLIADQVKASTQSLISADDLFTKRVDTIHAKFSAIVAPVSAKRAGMEYYNVICSRFFFIFVFLAVPQPAVIQKSAELKTAAPKQGDIQDDPIGAIEAFNTSHHLRETAGSRKLGPPKKTGKAGAKEREPIDKESAKVSI